MLHDVQEVADDLGMEDVNDFEAELALLRHASSHSHKQFKIPST